VYVAEGVRGEVTAVARRGAAAYAFYRGKTYVGQRETPARAGNQPADQAPKQPAASPTLEENLRQLNESNQLRQIERLNDRYRNSDQGGAAAKGFK
jgi:hypothetical protein